jgi:hypothetical protein
VLQTILSVNPSGLTGFVDLHRRVAGLRRTSPTAARVGTGLARTPGRSACTPTPGSDRALEYRQELNDVH